MQKLFLMITLLSIVDPAFAAEDYWVTSDRLNRRTCPSEQCGVVGQLFFREKVTVIETRSGWARISKLYNASCISGQSEYVDSGNSACAVANGIVEGKFSEWVSMTHLSKSRPLDPGAGATGIASLVNNSDDYRIYKDAFIAGAETLLKQKKCTAEDFEQSGGWYKSTVYPNQPIYFMYCGGFHKSNKIQLETTTVRIFK